MELMMMVVSGQFLQIILLEEHHIFHLLQQSEPLEVLLVQHGDQRLVEQKLLVMVVEMVVYQQYREQDIIGQEEVQVVILETEEELGQVIIHMLVGLELTFMAMLVVEELVEVVDIQAITILVVEEVV